MAGSADLVIEAVIEDFDAKKSVFDALGRHAKKDAVLASNSSTIAISRLAGITGRPEQCCNMHFFHPVTVMQLCEVVKGPKTSDATVATAPSATPADLAEVAAISDVHSAFFITVRHPDFDGASAGTRSYIAAPLSAGGWRIWIVH